MWRAACHPRRARPTLKRWRSGCSVRTAASHAVEALFSLLAARLAEGGITRFIVAGGETSGVVTQSLGITGFHIGPCISPGVPWVNALHAPVSLALKSGNFGDESFFIRAQREFQV